MGSGVGDDDDNGVGLAGDDTGVNSVGAREGSGMSSAAAAAAGSGSFTGPSSSDDDDKDASGAATAATVDNFVDCD